MSPLERRQAKIKAGRKAVYAQLRASGVPYDWACRVSNWRRRNAMLWLKNWSKLAEAK